MISEIVVILIFLCFLSVRTALVRRTWAFVTAVVLWGAARALMEISFKGGYYEYSWGSLPSLVAVCCLFLCVLFIFAACTGRARPGDSDADGKGKANGKGTVQKDAEQAPAGSTERLEQILKTATSDGPGPGNP
jgi:hypothetical protein